MYNFGAATHLPLAFFPMDKEPSPDPPESEAGPPGLSHSTDSGLTGFTSSWAELKRRKVVRMAITGTVLTVSI